MDDEQVIVQQERDEKLHHWIGDQPSRSVVAYELMVQFAERCREDGKDAGPFQRAATYIACGCSIDGESNSPTASGGRWMPSLNRGNFAWE